MPDFLAHIGHLTPKDEKSEIIKAEWVQFLKAPKKVELIPAASDRPPIDACLDLTLIVTHCLTEKPHYRAGVHELFGTLKLLCEFSHWPFAFAYGRPKEKLLAIYKSDYKLDDVEEMLLQVMFRADFDRLSNRDKQSYVSWLPPGSTDAIAKYVREMSMFYSFTSITQLNVLFSAHPTVEDAKRLEFVMKRAQKLGWSPIF
jgi:hypothetical protein